MACKDSVYMKQSLRRLLWNRLLVMAVALGVADKVIEQLKVAMQRCSKILQFMPVYSCITMEMACEPMQLRA